MATGKINLWQQMQTYLIVAVVTILTWLYAEANTLSEEVVPINIEFVSAADVHIEQPRESGATMTFLSPAGQMDAVRKLAQKPFKLDVIHENSPIDDPLRTISLKGRLSDDDQLKGVTIESVVPETMAIKVHRLEMKTLKIQVVGEGVQFAGAPGTDPGEATLKVPTSLVEQISDLKLQAQLDKEYDVGVTHTDVLQISLPQALDDLLPPNYSPVVNPPTTSATFTIEDQNKETDERVPVYLLVPPDAMGKYVIDIPDETERFIDIVLKGPGDVITKIKNNKNLVSVYLHLTHDQMEGGLDKDGSVSPKIHVPENVEVLGTPKSVSIKISKVPAASEQTPDAGQSDADEAER